MKFINKLKLSTTYSRLKKYNIDEKIIDTVLELNDFRQAYMDDILPFLTNLENYTYYSTENFKSFKKKINNDMIGTHIECVMEAFKNNTHKKYIEFVNKDKDYFVKMDDNIINIIKTGQSDKLFELLANKNINLKISDINEKLFNDDIYNLIMKNEVINGKHLLEIFDIKKNLNVLSEIVEKGFFQGFVYTYKNIPESISFIDYLVSEKKLAYISQFSEEFISQVGDATLKKLYNINVFKYPNEFNKVFEMAKVGNYQLIKDILDYKKIGISFSDIENKDLSKDIIEVNLNIPVSTKLLNKYFGIPFDDGIYMKLFLSTISNVEYSKEFSDKYKDIINLLNTIYSASDEENIKFSKTCDVNKIQEYSKLIKTLENDGNEFLKNIFSSDLVEKNNEIINTTTPYSIKRENNKEIKVYEFNGQPFTMLVHAIIDNPNSEHNHFVEMLINNPGIWNHNYEGNNYLSTSLISDKHMLVYGKPNNSLCVMYGFYEISPEAIKFTSIKDAGLNRKSSIFDMDHNMRTWIHEPIVNTVTTVDDFVNKTIQCKLKTNVSAHTEVGLLRVDPNTRKNIKPNYIVCMDYISEVSKKAAEYFDIPIYFIQEEKYHELPVIKDDKDSSQHLENTLKSVSDNEGRSL